MQTRNNRLLTLLILGPILPLAALLLLRDSIIRWSASFPVCPFYRLFHLYCPACGNTRSVVSLLKLDLLSSLRYNITPLFLLALGLLLYGEGILFAMGRRRHLVPRNGVFLFCCVGGMLLYYAVRNFIPFLVP